MRLAKPYPYLYKDKDRQGRERWRLRMPGRKTVTIKGTFGSPEFAATYRAAVEGETKGMRVAINNHGTMAALALSYLRSGAFAALSLTTQRARRHLIETYIIDKWGALPVAGLQRHHVKMIMEGLALIPGTARNVLSMLRILMAQAVEAGLRSDDPTAAIKRPRLSRDGWHPWTEAEIAQYEARHPIGTMARLGLALALNTCQRSSDLVEMGRQHLGITVIDGVQVPGISVRQHKTGTRLMIPLHPELQAIIDATPSANLTLLVSELGKPFKNANSFGHRMRRWAREAGLTGCPLHGLRKACCRRMAEAGCTGPEIMAVSGHKSLAEVERYIRDAEQKRMAERAIARTKSYPRGDHSYPQEKKA
jgi:integrase